MQLFCTWSSPPPTCLPILAGSARSSLNSGRSSLRVARMSSSLAQLKTQTRFSRMSMIRIAGDPSQFSYEQYKNNLAKEKIRRQRKLNRKRVELAIKGMRGTGYLGWMKNEIYELKQKNRLPTKETNQDRFHIWENGGGDPARMANWLGDQKDAEERPSAMVQNPVVADKTEPLNIRYVVLRSSYIGSDGVETHSLHLLEMEQNAQYAQLPEWLLSKKFKFTAFLVRFLTPCLLNILRPRWKVEGLPLEHFPMISSTGAQKKDLFHHPTTKSVLEEHFFWLGSIRMSPGPLHGSTLSASRGLLSLMPCPPLHGDEEDVESDFVWCIEGAWDGKKVPSSLQPTEKKTVSAELKKWLSGAGLADLRRMTFSCEDIISVQHEKVPVHVRSAQGFCSMSPIHFITVFLRQPPRFCHHIPKAKVSRSTKILKPTKEALSSPVMPATSLLGLQLSFKQQKLLANSASESSADSQSNQASASKSQIGESEKSLVNVQAPQKDEPSPTSVENSTEENERSGAMQIAMSGHERPGAISSKNKAAYLTNLVSVYGAKLSLPQAKSKQKSASSPRVSPRKKNTPALLPALTIPSPRNCSAQSPPRAPKTPSKTSSSPCEASTLSVSPRAKVRNKSQNNRNTHRHTSNKADTQKLSKRKPAPPISPRPEHERGRTKAVDGVDTPSTSSKSAAPKMIGGNSVSITLGTTVPQTESVTVHKRQLVPSKGILAPKLLPSQSTEPIYRPPGSFSPPTVVRKLV